MTDAFQTIRGRYEDRKISAREAFEALEARVLDRTNCNPVEREDCLELAAKIIDGDEAPALSEAEMRTILDDADTYFPGFRILAD